MRRAVVAIAASVLAAGALATDAFAANPTIQAQDSGVTVRLRGISAVDASVAWASGREGTVLRTTDGGAHWINVSVPEAKELDFRDVEGFDANTAVVLGIGPGEASRVYRTDDGGKTWSLALKNDDERAFFDCMVFAGDNGWMLGDPVDGRYQIRTTTDGGRTWALSDHGPEALKEEAAFAASGTCIARNARNALVIVGGGAAARLQVFLDNQWRAFDAQVPHRIPAAGVFSATPMGNGFLLVGGDFEHEAEGSASRATFVPDGMLVESLPAPRGYRSGAACFSASLCIAVGPTGIDALDAPATGTPKWTPLSNTGYDAIDRSGMTAWASGDKGRITSITFSTPSRPSPAASPSKP